MNEPLGPSARAAVALLRGVGWERPRAGALRARWLATAAALVLAFDAFKMALGESAALAAVVAAALSGAVLLTVRPGSPVGHHLGLSGALAFVAMTFPTTANHGYLTLATLALSAASAQLKSSSDRAAVLAVAKWLVVIVLLASGVQKLLHGCYDRGEYFAYHVARGTPRFARAWSLVISADELSRLRGLVSSNGPYRFEEGLAIAASLAVPLIEILLAIALLVPGLRRLAAFAAALFVVAIQAVAGEFTFAMLMLGLLAAFMPLSQQRLVVGVAFVTLLGLSAALVTGMLAPHALN